MFLGAVAIISSLLSAALLFSSVGISVNDWRKRTLDWRDQEYDKLRSLHAGFTRRKFEAVLGEPVFDRMSKSGKFREQTFRRREHWVQTVSDASGSVVLYSVTACGDEFHPSFRLLGIAGHNQARLELGTSTFRSVAREPSSIDYFGSGATANSRFLDIASAGNASNYKTWVWGLNDVCSDWFDEVFPELLERAFPQLESTTYRATSLGPQGGRSAFARSGLSTPTPRRRPSSTSRIYREIPGRSGSHPHPHDGRLNRPGLTQGLEAPLREDELPALGHSRLLLLAGAEARRRRLES